MSWITRNKLPVAALGVILLALAACGASGPGSAPTPPAAPPTHTPAVATPSPPPATATPAPVPPTAAPAPPGPSATPLPPTPLPTPLPPTPAPTPAGFVPGSVQLDLEQVTTGLQAPVFATHAGDGSGRLFVLEKRGTILALATGQSPQVFLDIRDRVGSRGSEQGLLGLAFHPQFAANGLFFAYYTGTNGDTVISRFQANADRTAADPATEAVLLTQAQPAANHNGGMLAFGPDGMLYAGLGDGGAAGDPWGNGQSLSTLLGKILRLDVDAGNPYAVPADNPFLGRDPARGEIWAYGLRNPWRFAFDRATGDLYIADVGQNQWEEINVQPAASPGGENYGWDTMEASTCFSGGTCDQAGLALPVAEYDHSQGCSITGGYVYRGAAQPTLQGAYFYGDYCSGNIWALSQDAAGQWRSDLLLDTNLQISSFGETEEGEVLVVDYGGMVYRLVDR